MGAAVSLDEGEVADIVFHFTLVFGAVAMLNMMT
jgi:hypothetical protein